MIGEAIKVYGDDRPAYLHDFGPNVPVESLGREHGGMRLGKRIVWSFRIRRFDQAF